MSNNSSWWANKLGSAPQPRYGITVQPATPAPQPQVQPQPEQQPAPIQHDRPVLDPTKEANAEIPMGEALRRWQGGEAHRTEGDIACPACGSRTGYTAYSGMGAGGARINGQKPRPHCFECGYNGSFSQGMESNWV